MNHFDYKSDLITYSDFCPRVYTDVGSPNRGSSSNVNPSRPVFIYFFGFQNINVGCICTSKIVDAPSRPGLQQRWRSPPRPQPFPTDPLLFPISPPRRPPDLAIAMILLSNWGSHRAPNPLFAIFFFSFSDYVVFCFCVWEFLDWEWYAELVFVGFCRSIVPALWFLVVICVWCGGMCWVESVDWRFGWRSGCCGWRMGVLVVVIDKRMIFLMNLLFFLWRFC